MSFVYFIRNNDTGLIKIGFSRSPMDRLVTLSHIASSRLELLAAEKGTREGERARHDQFFATRAGGEWFRPDAALMRLIDELRAAPIALPDPSIGVLLRLPKELIDRVDAYAAEFAKRRSWLGRFTRAATIQRLLTRALDIRDKQRKRRQ